MKLVRREMKRFGNDIIVAFLDTEGLDLGIDAMVEVPEVEDDTDRIPADELENEEEDDTLSTEDNDDPIVDPILTDNGPLDLSKVYFYVDTYNYLSGQEASSWDMCLSPINAFFANLSQDDQRKLCLFYINARRQIDNELVHTNIVDVATDLGNELYDLAIECDLASKLIYFAGHAELSHIPIPDLAYAGSRAHDVVAYTFREPEYIVVLAISILSKMLCPIWGDLIYRTTRKIDNLMKETYCLNVIQPILSTPQFRDVSKKLFDYVANIVNTAMAGSYPHAEFTSSYSGFSRERFHQFVHATILVKRYVSFDLYDESCRAASRSGNIMTWTASCARHAFTSSLNALNKKCHVMRRMDISDTHERGGGDDESNVSVLEYSSRVSHTTVDVPVLIRHGVRMAIRTLCREYGISERDFVQAKLYYEQYPIQVSIVNKILVGALLGNRLGGAHSIQYLDILEYQQLVIITQIFTMMRTGTMDLMYLLSSTTPEMPKSHTTTSPSASIDTIIHLTKNEMPGYKACRKAFSYAIDNVSIESVMNRVHEYITRFHHYHNTPPILSMMMDESPPAHGSLIEYDQMILGSFFKVLLEITVLENHQALGA